MECIVIGGGLAGLAAAGRLVRSGVSVTLIEARDRLGGRLWTVPTKSSQPIELGPEWIDKASALDRLLEKRGHPPRTAQGAFLRREGARLAETDLPRDPTAALLQRIVDGGAGDCSLTQALKQCCMRSEWDESRRLLLAYVQGFHAADPDRLSVEWLKLVESTQPAEVSQCRLVEGLSTLIDILASDLSTGCQVLTGTPVREVRWRKGAVEVTDQAGEGFRADRGIVTVPLPALSPRDGAVRSLQFSPQLPDKDRAAGLLEMGQVVKLVLLFRERFWENHPVLRRMLFVQDLDQAVPTWWVSDTAGAATLTGWAGGPVATRLPHDADHLHDLALTSLANTLGMPRREIEGALVARYFHDWRSDPWAGGAYTYVAVGGRDAPRALAQPVENTLFFAGEATAGHGYNATMEGALTSGWRAAAEVLGEQSTISQSR